MNIFRFFDRDALLQGRRKQEICAQTYAVLSEPFSSAWIDHDSIQENKTLLFFLTSRAMRICFHFFQYFHSRVTLET